MILIRMLSASLIASICLATEAHAIVLGQIDDFQDETTQGWVEGALSPNPPVNVPDMGPAGPGDHALSNTASGLGGPGSRMVVFNNAQWTGDYLSAGVDEISMMMRADPAASGLMMRVAIQGLVGNRYSSTLAFDLPNDGNWYPVSFNLSASDMMLVEGTQTLQEVLSGVSEVRILSAELPAWVADPVAATLFVDNVLAVPEPGHALAMVTACVALLTVRRRV